MLRTVLHSFYNLLGAVSEHIPVDDRVSTAYEEDAMFMSEVAYSFMDMVNSYRPLQVSLSIWHDCARLTPLRQARVTLEELLIKQLNDRHEETKQINECVAVGGYFGASNI